MAILTREALLGADDLRTEQVDVPEWGGQVTVRGLSLGAYQDVQERSSVAGAIDTDRLSVHLMIAGIVEPDLAPEDYELLRGKSMAALNRVAGAIMRLSGLGDDDVREAEARFPEGPDATVHVPAGEGPGDDRGAAAVDAEG